MQISVLCAQSCPTAIARLGGRRAVVHRPPAKVGVDNMNNIFWLTGVVVVVLVLGFLGLR
jgi:hypothetical protein